MVNYLDIIQMIKNGQNPQQVVMNVIKEQMGDTPMGHNLLSLAKNKETKKIEEIARNGCAQQGVDFDTAFTAFKQKLGY